MISSLLKQLCENGRFYACLSFLEAREIQIYELYDVVECVRQIQQHTLLIGKPLQATQIPKLRLSHVSDHPGEASNWAAFVEWVARHYGTPNTGLITCLFDFDRDSALLALEKKLGSLKDTKSLLALLAVSQITKSDSEHLKSWVWELLAQDRISFFALRIISAWASVLHQNDAELLRKIINSILNTELNKSSLSCAAFSLDCLNAKPQDRYRLVMSALDLAARLDLDDSLTELLHIYALRYFAPHELSLLKETALRTQYSDQSPFIQSLILSIDAWAHIGTEKMYPALESFSEYLSCLCNSLYPAEFPSPPRAGLPQVSVAFKHLGTIQSLLAEDGTSNIHGSINAITALVEDTNKLLLK